MCPPTASTSLPPMFVALLVYRDLGHFAGPKRKQRDSGSSCYNSSSLSLPASVPASLCPLSCVLCLCPSSGCRQDFCLALFVSTVLIVVVVVLVVCASASHVVFNKLISRSALVLRLQNVGTRTSSTTTTTTTTTGTS